LVTDGGLVAGGTVAAVGDILVNTTGATGEGTGVSWWGAVKSASYGTYLARAGAGRSFSGGTAVAGGSGGITSFCLRNRVLKLTTAGFVWENDAEELLMSINAGNGNVYMPGQLATGTALTVGTDCTITGNIAAANLNPTYNEYFTCGVDWPSNAYMYAITNAVLGADYKIRFGSTVTFVAKTTKVRIVTYGYISCPASGNTTCVWGCLATNNAATTFIYPLCGSGQTGYVGMCNTNFWKADFVSSHMYNVTVGTTYWLAVRFTPFFNGILNMTASNVVVEHISSWS
jgi:hypothetical protein